MSFYQYITNYNSDKIFWFTQTFNIELLPKDRICSSKVLRDSLGPELQNNYIKDFIFKECFMEYFKYTLLTYEPEYETPLR